MRHLVIPITLVLLSICAQAQQPLVNSGNLQIHSGASMTVFDDFTNNASGAFINNGSLFQKGHFTNNQASMTIGAGTLHLNGTSAQSINGTQTFKTNNLVTNNANGITLNNSLSVAGLHTFTAGIVASATYTKFLIYESTSSHTGEGDSKHVSGWVKRYGNTAFTFPVGNGTYLRPIAVSNLTGSPEFNVQYGGVTTNRFNVQSPLLSVDPYEYWTVNELTGSATAQVTLNWDKSKVNFPNWALMDIRSAQYTGGYWNNRGGTVTGSPSTSGSITSTSLNSFGPMTIGSTSLVLPLLFLDIHATRIQNYNKVTWKTTNEENVVRLEVQKSLNGSDFASIGTIAPHNKKETQTYSYNDTSSIRAVCYYRIKSIDFDGKFMYSKIVAVSENGSESLTLLTNPVQNNITLIALGVAAANYQYQLLATDGKAVLQGIIRYDGSGKINIPLHSSIPPGTYLLLIGNQKTYTYKIVVQ